MCTTTEHLSSLVILCMFDFMTPYSSLCCVSRTHLLAQEGAQVENVALYAYLCFKSMYILLFILKACHGRTWRGPGMFSFMANKLITVTFRGAEMTDGLTSRSLLAILSSSCMRSLRLPFLPSSNQRKTSSYSPLLTHIMVRLLCQAL